MSAGRAWGLCVLLVLATSPGMAAFTVTTEHHRLYTEAANCLKQGDAACAHAKCDEIQTSVEWLGLFCHAMTERIQGNERAFGKELDKALAAFKGTEFWPNKNIADAERVKNRKARRDQLMDEFSHLATFQFAAAEWLDSQTKGRAQEAEWLQRAEAGDVNAQFALAVAYYVGNTPGVEKNDQLAVKWFSRAAAQAHAPAEYGMGVAYADGRGVPKDPAQAVVWYRKAAAQGHAGAQFSVGRALELGDGVTKNERESVEWYRKAAAQGDSDAENSLGVAYQHGLGVPADLPLAIHWYQKAAAQNDPFAQTNLGILAETGEGMPKDHAKAAGWYELAVKQGHARAMWRLGVLLENGWGVTKDLARAASLYRDAGENGQSIGWAYLGTMYRDGVGVAVNGYIAATLFARAAEDGNTYAMFNLGLLYAGEKMQDYEKAVVWYQKAADSGHATAQNNLGAAYHNGNGVERNTGWAVYWYAKAAQQDEATAIENLQRVLPSRDSSVVTSASANLRSRPSTDADILTNLPRGTRVYSIGIPATGWRQVYVASGHRLGFVSADLIGRAPTSTPVARRAKSSDPYPARPAPRAGYVTCNTKCRNGDCYRTYADGRKVRFQAKQKWNPFDSKFEWDSGGC